MIPTTPTSPLSDVIRCVRDIFGAIGDATPIMTGKHYLEDFGTGSAPRVLFVPDPRGKWGDPPTGTGGSGYVSGVAHGCTVYVRGAEDGTDEGRFDNAYALADLVQNALLRAARGRVVGEDFGDNSPAGVDAYGADIAFSFTYARGVQRSAVIWALPATPIAKSPPDPMKPPGTYPSTSIETDVTVTPTT